jgi:hypothetical protein
MVLLHPWLISSANEKCPPSVLFYWLFVKAGGAGMARKKLPLPDRFCG